MNNRVTVPKQDKDGRDTEPWLYDWGWTQGPITVPDCDMPEMTGDQREQLREHNRTMADYAAVEEYMRRRTGRPDRPFPANVAAVLTRAPDGWDAERILAGLDGARGTPRSWDWFRCAMDEVRKQP